MRGPGPTHVSHKILTAWPGVSLFSLGWWAESSTAANSDLEAEHLRLHSGLNRHISDCIGRAVEVVHDPTSAFQGHETYHPKKRTAHSLAS